MRQINWRPFRNSPILHIDSVSEVQLYAYDLSGRLYNTINDPTMELPLLFWVDLKLWSYTHGVNAQFGFTYDGYVHGWRGLRLSSLPRHEYYFKNELWYTTADRDFIFAEITKGMD